MPSDMIEIVDDVLEGEAEGFRLIVLALVDYESGRGSISYEVIDREGNEVVSLSQQFRIENPLITSITILSMASAFASCVAIGMAGVSGGELYKHYSSSKNDYPNYSIGERCRDMIDRYKQSTGTLKAGAAAAISACLAGLGLG